MMEKIQTPSNAVIRRHIRRHTPLYAVTNAVIRRLIRRHTPPHAATALRRRPRRLMAPTLGGTLMNTVHIDYNKYP